MALMMKTSQKLAVRSTCLAFSARPLPVRPLHALPEPGEKTPETSESVTKPFPAEPFTSEDPFKLQTPFKATGGVDAPPPTFTDILGFIGTPEIINGRLAMLGFVAAVAAEISTGARISEQVQSNPSLIAITFGLFIVASLVPAYRRAKDSFGPFTPGAELINGRAAMIGFAAMLMIEAVRHAPLFSA